VYRSRQELAAGLAEALTGPARLAMEYSPGGALPVIARVDAGTVEAVRALGKEIVSSADLVQVFEAVWSPAQEGSHLEVERRLMVIRQRTFDHLRTALARGESLTEYSVQQAMLGFYREQELFLDHGPIVAVGPDSGNPHYEPDPARDRPIQAGDFLLLDWW